LADSSFGRLIGDPCIWRAAHLADPNYSKLNLLSFPFHDFIGSLNMLGEPLGSVELKWPEP